MSSFIVVCVFIVLLAEVHSQNPQKEIAHRTVLQNSAYESQLPPNLLNPFYQNPNLRPILAKSSWFGPGERQVKSRDTEKIPRKSIFNVLNHAGLLPQQQL